MPSTFPHHALCITHSLTVVPVPWRGRKRAPNKSWIRKGTVRIHSSNSVLMPEPPQNHWTTSANTLPGLLPQSFRFHTFGMEPEICSPHTFPGDAHATLLGHTLRATPRTPFRIESQCTLEAMSGLTHMSPLQTCSMGLLSETLAFWYTNSSKNVSSLSQHNILGLL